MGDVTITITSGAPQKAVRGIGTGGCIARDTSAGWLADYPNPFLLERDSYADSAYYSSLDTDSLLKASIDTYFSQNGAQSAYFYRFGTATGGTVIDEPTITQADGTVTRFDSQQSPVSAITAVSIDYGDAAGLQVIDPVNWDANVDGTLFDGSISFVGTWTYAGTDYTTAPSGSNVYVSYTFDALSAAWKALRELNIQIIWYGFDPEAMLAADTYTGVSLLQDYRYGMLEARVANAMAKWRHFTGMIPMNKTPSDLDTLYGDVATPRYFRLWSTSQLADRHATLVGNRSSTDDVGAAYSGVIAGIAPQKNLDKQAIAITYDTAFEMTAVRNFENAGMSCIHKPWEANYSIRIHRGFTTDQTTANFKRINYGRVLDDIQFSLHVDLWSALQSNTIQMNKGGMALMRSYIEAVFLEKKMLGRIDGLSSIVIPLEQLFNKSTLTAAEAIVVANAKANLAILGIKITYVFSGNPETLTLNLGSV